MTDPTRSLIACAFIALGFATLGALLGGVW